MKPDQLAFFADLPEITDDRPATSRIQLAKTGRFKHPRYGPFTVTRETFASFIANFAAGVPAPELPVDFDHEPDLGGSTRACGWIKALHPEDDALYATVEWTDAGAVAIRTKSYQFISPTWSMDYVDDEGTKHGPTLLACGCTNRPFFQGMAVVTLSLSYESVGFAEETTEEAEACERAWAHANELGVEAEHREKFELTRARFPQHHGTREGEDTIVTHALELQGRWWNLPKTLARRPAPPGYGTLDAGEDFDHDGHALVLRAQDYARRSGGDWADIYVRASTGEIILP